MMLISLSDAMDCICPQISDHQQRVTYIAMQIARSMKNSRVNLKNLFCAALLHDIGAIRFEDREELINSRDFENILWHSEIGYELYKSTPLLANAAPIILYHHSEWRNCSDNEIEISPVPIESHIIHLADSIELLINNDTNILEQSDGIIEQIASNRDHLFHPDCVAAFKLVANCEAFWLKTVSSNIHDFVALELESQSVSILDSRVLDIASIFMRMVDSISPWTVAHSSGVAGAAIALARLCQFSNQEQAYIYLAGILHDLGKLTVPAEIINQDGEKSPHDWAIIKGHTFFTYQILKAAGFPQFIIEWAAYHHERINGNGYPFHISGKDLSLGSRIMCVADVMAAVMEDRPYREAMDVEVAKSTLKNMGNYKLLDSNLVTLLIDNFNVIDNMRREVQEAYLDKQKLFPTLVSRLYETESAPAICLD